MAVHGLGLTEHVQGTDGVMALINLALLTGNIGKPGSGVNPLRGQNNVQGAAHMGCDPAFLPGSIPIDEGRASFAAQWGTALPLTRGLNLVEMLDAASAGTLKGLVASGDVYSRTRTPTDRTRPPFAGFVVVQDLFLNETAREFGQCSCRRARRSRKRARS
jgi:formate dehydrogenase major subunit